MNTKRILKNTDTDYISILLLCLCVTAVFFVIWTFTGQWPWKSQAYNSYILQAQSWLEGRLDLGRDYPYLELAIFNNKYYCKLSAVSVLCYAARFAYRLEQL